MLGMKGPKHSMLDKDLRNIILGARYLSWTGLTTKVFNVGEYRREATQDYRLCQNNIWS